MVQAGRFCYLHRVSSLYVKLGCAAGCMFIFSCQICPKEKHIFEMFTAIHSFSNLSSQVPMYTLQQVVLTVISLPLSVCLFSLSLVHPGYLKMPP